ncbi:hypothetical protein SAY86_004648 [Trapa natans]|uniref:Uncharacterized protein n=1 Tax=Trapa natans TaxID=22666 RepID=A0AAN7N4W7_TRANT|nr:hypothetical protein SAY86_004648 [Trapa natans]
MLFHIVDQIVSSERYDLQTFPGISVPFESYYLTLNGKRRNLGFWSQASKYLHYFFKWRDNHVSFIREMPKQIVISGGLQNCSRCQWIDILWVSCVVTLIRYKIFLVDFSTEASLSFCYCDPNHGGLDCNVEIVSSQGHSAIYLPYCIKCCSNFACLLGTQTEGFRRMGALYMQWNF